jgi:uncharacterized Fe-S cluster-containing radical SAM superfamily protein
MDMIDTALRTLCLINAPVRFLMFIECEIKNVKQGIPTSKPQYIIEILKDKESKDVDNTLILKTTVCMVRNYVVIELTDEKNICWKYCLKLTDEYPFKIIRTMSKSYKSKKNSELFSYIDSFIQSNLFYLLSLIKKLK